MKMHEKEKKIKEKKNYLQGTIMEEEATSMQFASPFQR